MLEFLKILFYAKSILLTPQVIDIDGELSIDLNPPVSAITKGAAVVIDVSSISDEIGTKGLGIKKSREFLNKLLPKGSVFAKLQNKNDTVVLDRMAFALGNSDAKLILSAENGVPTGVDFNTLDIVSNVPLERVTVTWKN